MYLKELEEKRTAAVNEITNLRNAMANEKRSLTSDETVKWNAANAEYDSISGQIKQLKRADDISGESEKRSIPGREDLNGKQDKEIDGEQRNTELFRAYIRSHAGKDLTESQRKIVQESRFNLNQSEVEIRIGKAPRDIVEARAMSAIVGSAGGIVCTAEAKRNIEIALLQYNSVRPYASVIRTSTGNDLPWPTCNDTGNEGEIVGESVAASAGVDPVFASKTLKAYKYSSKIILIPYELIEDADFDIINFVTGLAGERIARRQSKDFTIGTGAGQPTGFMVDAVLGKTTAASATGITGDELLDLYYELDPAYLSNARWMMNSKTMGHVRKLKDGNGVYMWQPGLAGINPDTINGKPVVMNQSMATIAATAKTVAFGDFSKYAIRDVNSMRMMVLKELYAANDQVGVLLFFRSDAKLINAGTNPIKYLIQKA